jgi:hypothetical protein
LKPASVSTKQERIAELARENPAMAYTSLNHYLDAEWLEYAFECTRKDGAVGVDGQTAESYAERDGPLICDVRGRSVTIGEGRHSGQSTGKTGVSDSNRPTNEGR